MMETEYPKTSDKFSYELPNVAYLSTNTQRKKWYRSWEPNSERFVKLGGHPCTELAILIAAQGILKRRKEEVLAEDLDGFIDHMDSVWMDGMAEASE